MYILTECGSLFYNAQNDYWYNSHLPDVTFYDPQTRHRYVCQANALAHTTSSLTPHKKYFDLFVARKIIVQYDVCGSKRQPGSTLSCMKPPNHEGQCSCYRARLMYKWENPQEPTLFGNGTWWKLDPKRAILLQNRLARGRFKYRYFDQDRDAIDLIDYIGA